MKPGGTIILNRDDKFFHFLFKKAKKYKLKILSFGIHKNSDIRLKKIITKENYSKIFVKINNKTIDLKIKDLNFHNVLSSLAIINSLKLIL